MRLQHNTLRKVNNFTRIIRDIFWQHFGNCVFCPATIINKIEDITGYNIECEDSVDEPFVKVIRLKPLFMTSTDSLAVLEFVLNENAVVTDIRVFDEFDK